MSQRDPELVLPSPRSRIGLPLRDLAQRLDRQGWRGLQEARLALALEINREPSPQDLWDRFRELHPALAAQAQRRAIAATRDCRHAPHNPYSDELPAHLDDARFPAPILDAAAGGPVIDAARAESLYVLRALQALPKPKVPKP